MTNIETSSALNRPVVPGPVPPWPVAIVSGMLGSGKTTMIARLLVHPAMADTLVLVNEFGEVGLDHLLIKAVTDRVVLLPNGCLCCTIRQDIVQTLRGLYRDWLAGLVPDFGRILIETTGLAEPAPLIASIAGHPLLADLFELRSIATVVDGQHGLRQIADRATCRNQVCVADHLVVSKGDLIDVDAAAALARGLDALNGLATVTRSDAVDPEIVFARQGLRPSGMRFRCDEASDHLTGISTRVLRPNHNLAWSAFRIWLHGLLEVTGSQLLRLKGRLTFDEATGSVIVQAVHHIFYPLVEAPAGIDDEGDFLVVIFDGAMSPAIMDRLDQFGSLVAD